MKKILILAAAVLVLFACSKEDGAPGVTLQGGETQKTVFYAVTESTPISGTKVYADENLRLLWNENDTISIFNMRTLNEQFLFMGEDGDNGGSFEPIPYSGFATGNPLDYVYAVYPYNARTQVGNGGENIALKLPAVQAYKEHSFGIGANTMVAVTEGSFLAFKNACGYLKLRFYGDNVKVKSVSIRGNLGEPIAGNAFIVNPSTTQPPALYMSGEGTSSTITINCTTPVTLGTSSTDYTEFIFVVPPVTFTNGFKITVTSPSGSTFEKSTTKSLAITRNKMESMGTLKVDLPEFVEFDNDSFRDYCLAKFDTNTDGVISIAEALEVTTIDVYNTSTTGEYYSEDGNDYISTQTLGGIELFKNLENLRVDGSSRNPASMGALDFSKNTALKNLVLQYTNIESLNIEGLTSLESLWIQSTADHPTTVGLNGQEDCISLKTFIASYTSFTENLNLSNNTALESVSVDHCQLQSLNVSGLSHLKKLYCHYNPDITSIDFSGLTAIEDLRFSGTGLTAETLDLRHLTNLKDLEFSEIANLKTLHLENLTQLRMVIGRDGNLTDIYLDGDVALKSLNVENNRLTSLVLPNCPGLNTLFVNGNNLSSLDLSVITPSTGTTVVYLWPQQNTLGTITVNSTFWNSLTASSPKTYLKYKDGSQYLTQDPNTAYADWGTQIIHN